MYGYKIILKLGYYNSFFLDRVIGSIVFKIKDVFPEVCYSVVSLPVKKTTITVLKSPHVFKKAREQFSRKVYKKILVFYVVDYFILKDLKHIIYNIISLFNGDFIIKIEKNK